MENYWPKNVDDYVQILFKRRKLLLMPFVTILTVSALIYPFLPRIFVSHVHMTYQDQQMLNAIAQGTGGGGNLEKKLKYLRNQVMGGSNLGALARQLNLPVPEDPKKNTRFIRALRKKAEVKDFEEIVRVTFEDENPVASQQGAQFLAESLIHIDRALKQDEMNRAIKFIEDQLKIYRTKIQSSDQSFFTSRWRNELNDALRKRQLILGGLGQQERTISREVVRELSPVALRLRSELAEEQIKLNQLLMTATKEHPLVTELTERIDELKTRLEQETQGAVTVDSSIANPAYQKAILELKEVDLQIIALEKNLVALQAGQYRAEKMTEQDLMAMERDKKVNEDIYKSLLVRLENAQISKRLDEMGEGEPFRIIEPAAVPEAPEKPNPWKVAGMTLLLGLLAGLGAVFSREYLDSSFRGVTDAKSYLELPLLAAVPRMVAPRATLSVNGDGLPLANGRGPKPVAGTQIPFVPQVIRDPQVSPHIVTFHDPGSLPAEQYRLFRTYLARVKEKQPLQTILLTSATASEGKTTTALNTAVSMAKELNDRVLLIDCDLRRGRAAEQMGIQQREGLSNYLAGGVDLERILIRTKVERLTVIPAGKWVQNSGELVGSDRMTALIKTLRTRYDTIILDAPPVLSLSDVPLLSALSDGVVMVVRDAHTRREVVAESLSLLRQAKVTNILGFILTYMDQHIPRALQRYFGGGYLYEVRAEAS